jgi:hypothetical protein
MYSSTLLPYGGDPNMFMNRLYQPDTNIQDLGTSPHSSLVLDHNAKYQPRQDNLLYLQNSRPENMITSPGMNNS